VVVARDARTYQPRKILQHRYFNPFASEKTLVIWANTPITLRK
jgi:hypothetical protein